MKLIRYTPSLKPLREWEALFAPLFATPLGSDRGDGSRRNPSPGVDWFEDEHHYHVRIELPGVKRKNLKLDFEDGLLRLTHERVAKTEGDSGQKTRSEWVVRCPEGVRSEGTEARLAEGILQVSLPKEEVRKPASIAIH